jgi:hypothetical protein
MHLKPVTNGGPDWGSIRYVKPNFMSEGIEMKLLMYQLGYLTQWTWHITQVYFSRPHAETEAERLNEQWKTAWESRVYQVRPIWTEDVGECVSQLGIHISKHLEQQWAQMCETKQPTIAKFNERVILMLPPPEGQ